MFQRFFLDFGFFLGSFWVSSKPILGEFLDFDSILGSFWAPVESILGQFEVHIVTVIIIIVIFILLIFFATCETTTTAFSVCFHRCIFRTRAGE